MCMPRCTGYNFDHLAMFWCVFVSKHKTYVRAFFFFYRIVRRKNSSFRRKSECGLSSATA